MLQGRTDAAAKLTSGTHSAHNKGCVAHLEGELDGAGVRRQQGAVLVIQRCHDLRPAGRRRQLQLACAASAAEVSDVTMPGRQK